MKETTKTSRTAGYLEKMFRALNQEFFSGELEEPIITIQSTPGAYGHVTVRKAWKRKDSWRHELNIGAETLDRPIEDVAATMLHEMVHLYNLAHEVQDCSRGGSYHNRRFRDEAERRGLVIGHHEKYGWTITNPSDKLLEFIIEQGWTEISINRGGNWTPPPSTGAKNGNGGTPTGTNEKPKKSSTRKLICPKCKCSVRATKTVNILCGDCMEKMIEV
ncbi:SprT-like domain-containing protein [Dysosmobacter sp.]|uniref:SprT-like domain-containing protein n=1 Tax=Dysosmobacter sp. TaxID=2591382 RepID=UPI002A8B748A|nr:SprT-like domain-containing protein [Dysosmobacter sp.]MDY3281293.1 SprT-like domain-containing protein [Dysosmobacter sp.]